MTTKAERGCPRCPSTRGERKGKYGRWILPLHRRSRSRDRLYYRRCLWQSKLDCILGSGVERSDRCHYLEGASTLPIYPSPRVFRRTHSCLDSLGLRVGVVELKFLGFFDNLRVDNSSRTFYPVLREMKSAQRPDYLDGTYLIEHLRHRPSFSHRQ